MSTIIYNPHKPITVHGKLSKDDKLIIEGIIKNDDYDPYIRYLSIELYLLRNDIRYN